MVEFFLSRATPGGQPSRRCPQAFGPGPDQLPATFGEQHRSQSAQAHKRQWYRPLANLHLPLLWLSFFRNSAGVATRKTCPLQTYENLVPDRQTDSLLRITSGIAQRRKMKPTRILWIAPLLLLAAAALAQQTPVSADTLWAGGDGKFESAPDTALVQFSISVQQPELRPLTPRRRSQRRRSGRPCTTNGINPRDAEIGSFSMTPSI